MYDQQSICLDKHKKSAPEPEIHLTSCCAESQAKSSRYFMLQKPTIFHVFRDIKIEKRQLEMLKMT